MRFRKLRIAWSVGCGIACVLLIALWVRSYFAFDFFNHGFPDKSGYIVESINGALVIAYFNRPVILDSGYGTHAPDVGQSATRNTWKGTWAGFRLAVDKSFGYRIALPFWFLTLLLMAIGALPWFRWSNRFTLRTLLIATTLFAVVVGLIVSAASK